MVNIQWFPGHMTKAKRNMQENMKLVDLVIELRDARIVNSSKNPMIDKLIQDKPRVIILTKKDKADPNVTKEWIKNLKSEKTEVIAIDTLHENIINDIVNASKKVCNNKLVRWSKKGIKARPLRAMVVGIPNVGKSTLINKIANKKIAKTSDKPGVTKALQWVKLNRELELLDTPGVLWPKFESDKVAYNLAIVGSINDKILHLDDIVGYAFKYLLAKYPSIISQRYDVEEIEDIWTLVDNIAIKKGWILRGKEIDYDRTFKVILNEIRDDKFGRISWERPNEE